MHSTVAGIGSLSPVRMDLSKRRSVETSMRRRSAGTLEPRVMVTMSPRTRSAAGTLQKFRIESEGNEGHLLERVTFTGY